MVSNGGGICSEGPGDSFDQAQSRTDAPREVRAQRVRQLSNAGCHMFQGNLIHFIAPSCDGVQVYDRETIVSDGPGARLHVGDWRPVTAKQCSVEKGLAETLPIIAAMASRFDGRAIDRNPNTFVICGIATAEEARECQSEICLGAPCREDQCSPNFVDFATF